MLLESAPQIRHDLKPCGRCGALKPYRDFYNNRNTPSGKTSWCKACTQEYQQQPQAAKKRAAHMQARRQRDPIAFMLVAAKTRAKHTGLEFTLEREDIPAIPARCPVLGIPLQVQKDNRADASPSLDRIDNSKGYVPGNVAIISLRANRIKSDATPEEIFRLHLYVRGLHMTPEEEKDVLKQAINEWLEDQWSSFGKWTARGLLAALLAAAVAFVFWVKGLPPSH